MFFELITEVILFGNSDQVIVFVSEFFVFRHIQGGRMEIGFLYNFNLVTEDLDRPLVNQGWLSMATCLLRGLTKGKQFWKTDLIFEMNSWLADSVTEELRTSSQGTSLINLTKRSLFFFSK